MGEKKPASFGSLVDAMLALEQLRRVSEEGAIMARELGRSPVKQAAQKTGAERDEDRPPSTGGSPQRDRRE
jgi:hypothetical protein